MQSSAPGQHYSGILLAAGMGKRFDPTGAQNKLLQVLPGGDSVVVMSARNLASALTRMLIVVPTGSPVLTAHLTAAGYPVTKCAQAATGMAASLVHGVRASPGAAGWIIALADMPFVQPATMKKLLDALAQGADIAIPSYRGRRGNPVAFSSVHLDHLLQLSGDIGARMLLQQYPVQEVPVDDPGIHHDIDTLSDLKSCRILKEHTHA